MKQRYDNIEFIVCDWYQVLIKFKDGTYKKLLAEHEVDYENYECSFGLELNGELEPIDLLTLEVVDKKEYNKLQKEFNDAREVQGRKERFLEYWKLKSEFGSTKYEGGFPEVKEDPIKRLQGLGSKQ